MILSSWQRQFLIVSGLFLCLTVPYLSLQQKIVSDLHGELFFSPIQVVRWTLKLSLFSFVVATLYVWTLHFFKKIGIAKTVIIPINIILYFSQMVISLYYDYYSEIPHLQLLTMVSEAFQVRNQIYLQLFDLQEWTIVLGCLGNIVFSFLFLNYEVCRLKYIRVASLCIIIFYTSYELMNFQRKDIHWEFIYGYSYVSTSYGFTYAYALMIQDFLHSAEQPSVPYPGRINPRNHEKKVSLESKKKPLKNVIIIQVESLGNMMPFYEVGGKKIMPFLNNLASRSVLFENFIAQHSGGGSSDAELSVLFSLLPLRSHSGLRTADYTKATTLLNLLKKHGYTAYAMHANHRQFYNRAFAYPQLGFDTFYSRRDYEGGDRGWKSKDIDFFKQSLEKISALPEPYLAYLITIQGHGPYENYSQETKKKYNFKPHYTKTQIDYLCTFHEVDHALDFFITQLSRLGILDQAILMIFADEFPSIFNEKNRRFEKISLMIVDSDIHPHIETKLGSHLDIASTITDLLGIPEADCWLGDSMLSSVEDRVVLLNNLTVIRREGAGIVAQRDIRYKKFVEYSRSILE